MNTTSELRICDNYRGISLHSLTGKVFTKILNHRFVQHVDDNNIMPECENGARKGRSSMDSLYCVKMAIQHMMDKNKPAHLTFYDVEKAYDRVPQQALWQILFKIGVPAKMLNAIKNIHDGTQARVEVEGTLCDPFEVRNGVRQGFCLASLLFGICTFQVRQLWYLHTPWGVKLGCNINGVPRRTVNTKIVHQFEIGRSHTTQMTP